MRTIPLATALLLAHAIACAQTSYPAKPVRIIVPSAPGGGTDITTRALNLRFTENFLAETGLRMVHVLYKGAGPANIDVIAGHAVALMGSMISVAPFIRDGRMRALGVTSARRSAIAPNVPTIAESGVPGYESIQWYGLLAPAGTPRDIVAKLNEAVVRAIREPAIRKRFADDGVDAVGSTLEQFAQLIRDDIAKWHRVVKQAGIKPE